MKIGCDGTYGTLRKDDRAVELLNHCRAGKLRARDEHLVEGRSRSRASTAASRALGGPGTMRFGAPPDKRVE
jgi:hypothetical protein